MIAGANISPADPANNVRRRMALVLCMLKASLM